MTDMRYEMGIGMVGKECRLTSKTRWTFTGIDASGKEVLPEMFVRINERPIVTPTIENGFTVDPDEEMLLSQSFDMVEDEDITEYVEKSRSKSPEVVNGILKWYTGNGDVLEQFHYEQMTIKEVKQADQVTVDWLWRHKGGKYIPYKNPLQ